MDLFKKITDSKNSFFLRGCVSIEGVSGILDRYADLGIPSEIAEAALNQLAVIRMGRTDQERNLYASVAARLPGGIESVVARLVAASPADRDTTLQLSSLARSCRDRPEDLANIISVLSRWENDAVPGALREACRGRASQELGSAYKRAFRSLCQKGTPEALDVAAEMFHANITPLGDSLCPILRRETQNQRLSQDGEGLLKAFLEPRRLASSVERPRQKDLLRVVFGRIQSMFDENGCQVNLNPVFEAASAQRGVVGQIKLALSLAFFS